MIPALCILGTVLAASLGEWFVHRYWMHTRGTPYWRTHAVEHHGAGANDANHMGFTFREFAHAWLISLPANLLLSLVWPWQLASWTAFQAYWFATWGPLHRWIHGEPGYTWAAVIVPWSTWTRRHHLAHHRNVRTCYGAMFPWTDTLLGTGGRK